MFIILCFIAIITIIQHDTHAHIPQRNPYVYLFFQQTNDMCTIAPMLNRKRLLEIRNLSTDDNQCQFSQAFQTPHLALTRRQWFGESHQFLYAWRLFLVNFMESEEGERYLNHALENALVAPFFYDQHGNHLCPNGAGDHAEYPFFLVDISPENLDASPSFMLPLAFTNKEAPFPLYSPIDNPEHWVIYNKTTKQFEAFAQEALHEKEEFRDIKAAIDQNPTTVNTPKSLLGFYGFILPQNRLVKSFKNTMPYLLGMLKLLFLTLGINSNNDIIQENDQEYDVHKKIYELTQKDKETNPWSSQYFKKDFFLQYALAEILKKDHDLKDKLIERIDIAGLKYWQTYDNITSGKTTLYKKDGTPYQLNHIRHYLPGQEQALAYFLTEILRCLWYGAASKDARVLYKIQHADPSNMLVTAKLWWKNLTYTQLKKAALKKIDDSSFIDIWYILVNRIKRKYSTITDWVSFDGHGWVVSFDEKLIQLQKEHALESNCDFEFLDTLQFAGIESWWGSDLEVFYKKLSPQEDH